jgi:hypothetical protein
MHTSAIANPHSSIAPVSSSTKAVWVGRIFSAVPVLFLTFDTAIKVLQLPVALEATQQLGFTASAVFAVGVIEAVCLVLYLVPRTSVLGAVLWTGYFGGAIATHLRAGSPVVTHTLFPIYMAVLLWAGLWLRDGRLRRIVSAAFRPASR